MTRDQILEELLSRVNDGLWVMAAMMKQAPKRVSKEKIGEVTNAYFIEFNPEKEWLPIRSRHTLDIIVAKLEGAALIDVIDEGRAKMYAVSLLGKELINYRKRKLELQKEA